MAFFDLSIPYMEKSGAPASDTRSRRDSRLRTAARAMELGYTAVAYDRPFRGVLSDADRCQVVPFPALSFLESGTGASLPAFTASVALHRELLSVPRASPFRQYTRITVSVDSAAAASVLNSGNRLLRSYDIVATRPVNQMAFDQACKASEVDIISLNFSQKLPFRLKLPMVQAAIKRGVYFEISYSHLIAYGHASRQILSEAKRLGEWTRGKNLIISGSATSLNEVRGPHDVANLTTVLLGLTMERAKSAISRNCRSLVVNALRKKDCYFKEAIRIERILPEEKVNSQENWFKDWNDWDPISTGADDLPSLDDMAKLFSAASTHSKSENAIDLSSSINGMTYNTPLFPCSNRHGLDYANARRPFSEFEHNNVNRVSVEVSVMVANPAPNAANVEVAPCSDENGMAIDAFECAGTSISSRHLSLTGFDLTDDYGAVENTDEANKDVDGLLDCSSSLGTRDQMSMFDNGAIITIKNHYLEKSSSSDVQNNDNPDMMEVHDQFVLPHKARTTSNCLGKIGMREQLAVRLETSIFDYTPVQMELENQQVSIAEVESTNVNEMEMQVQTSISSKKTCSNGFTAVTEGKKMSVSTAEIPETRVLSEDPTRTKEQNFSPENNSTLEKDVIEGQQSIQRLVSAGGVNNGYLHKSGKHGRFRGRSNRRGYLLSVKNFCKSMLFKKKARRLSRAHRFLYD